MPTFKSVPPPLPVVIPFHTGSIGANPAPATAGIPTSLSTAVGQDTTTAAGSTESGTPPPAIEAAKALANAGKFFANAAPTQGIVTNSPSTNEAGALSSPSSSASPPPPSATDFAESFFKKPQADKRAAIAGFFDRLLAAAAGDGETTEILTPLLAQDALLSVACAAVLDGERFNVAMAEAGFGSIVSLIDVPSILVGIALPIQMSTGMTLPQFLDALCAENETGRHAKLAAIIAPAQWQMLAGFLSSVDLSKFDGVNILTDPASGLSGDNEIEKFLCKNLPLYYANLPLKDTVRVIRGQISLPIDATAEDRVLELLQSSGPSIKKLFQLYAGQLKSKKLRKALENLKDRNRPFPFDVAKKIIEEELGAPISELFLSFSEETKAGTVAQVYKAVLKTPNGPRAVAVKVRRPDYLEQIETELDILEKLAHDAFSRGVVVKLRKILTDEGDFRVSARRTRELGRTYRRARTIKLVPGIPNNPRVLVMDWVEAPSFSKLKKLPVSRTALVRQYKETAAIYAEWLERALTGDGDYFFHGDPHGGNLNYDDVTGTVGYFDADNAASMTQAQKNAFVGVAVTMALQMPEALADHLAALSETNNLPEKTRRALIAAIRDELTTSDPLTQKIGAIIVRATNLGIELANGMPEMQRAMMEFGAEMADIKERIVEMGDPGFFERIMFKLNSQEALNARAILDKIRENATKGIEGISLELGRRYLSMIDSLIGR